MTTWVIILGMALVTFAVRVVPVIALRGEVAPWLRRWLSYVPIAVFAALAVPPLLLASNDTAHIVIGTPAVVGVVGALTAWCTGNLVLTLATGMATFWLLRWLGS